ncbi:MAG: exo-alpha-sialidase [Thermoguttaceae bacterium]
MPRPRPRSLPIAAYLLLTVAASATAADSIQMHPGAEALPFDHQGPFVATGDGGVLAVGSSQAFVSRDEGKSWQAYPLFHDNEKYLARDERALLRLRDGTVVFAWMNDRQRSQGGPWGQGGQAEVARWVLPVYVTRSTDDGQTWSEPLMIQEGWCGAIRSMIQLRSGRIVLVGQKVIPWRHVSLTYVSDDQGRSWKASNLLDMETENGGDHGGTMEGTVAQLGDDRLLILLRTTRGWFWQASSSDEGLTWEGLARSPIRSSTCCGQLARLADDRLALLWNRPTDDNPRDISSRQELSFAWSADDGKTWSAPVVLSSRPLQPGEPYHAARQSYPYLYERRPGQLWITTMQGGLRMKISQADLLAPAGSAAGKRPFTIVAFGDSTTVRRAGVESVYTDLLRSDLPARGLHVRVVNQGVPSDRTTDALQRFQSDVRDFHPDLVVFLFGLNDAAVDVWRGEAEPRVPVETFRKNLVAMVQALKADGAAPVLVTPNPMGWTEKLKELYAGPPYHDRSPYDAADPLGFNAVLPPYVEAVGQVAREEQVPLVDLHRIFIEYQRAEGCQLADLLLDGMHPNDRGHRLLADALLPVITAALAPSVDAAHQKD